METKSNIAILWYTLVNWSVSRAVWICSKQNTISKYLFQDNFPHIFWAMRKILSEKKGTLISYYAEWFCKSKIIVFIYLSQQEDPFEKWEINFLYKKLVKMQEVVELQFWRKLYYSKFSQEGCNCKGGQYGGCFQCQTLIKSWE